MRRSPQSKSKSRPKYVEKVTSDTSPGKSEPKPVNKPRPSVRQFFYVLEGSGDFTESEVKLLAGQELIGVTARRRNVRSLDLLERLATLRWVQLVDCGLTDSVIGRLRVVKNLETAILSNNILTEVKGFEPLRDCKKLSCLAVDGNPISGFEQKLQQLRKLLDLDLLVSEPSPTYIVALEIKRECCLAEYENIRQTELASSLIRDVFELDNRAYVDLKKYLKQLKSDRSSIQVAYQFLLSAKKFAKDTPKITSVYQLIPWVMVEEWPETNFLKEYSKDLPTLNDLIALVEQEDPAAVIESRNLDHIVHHLLDEYYELELKRLFEAARRTYDYERVVELVKFVFETAIRYFQRQDERYNRFASYIYGRGNVTTELTMLLLKNKPLMEGLELVVVSPEKAYSADEERIITQALRKIKEVKVGRLIDEARQFSTKSLPLCTSNLNFFNDVLKTNQDSGIKFDLAKADRLELFSDIIFEQFNIRDYQDFALFIREGETKSEQYFSRNIQKLGLVIRLYEWMSDLDELQQNILKVPEEEKYNMVAIYFKRLLGRPKVDIRYLKRYFGYFNFELIEKLVDSEARVSSLKILMAEFKNDFSFLMRFIVEGHKNDDYDRMKDVCRKMAKPDGEQRSFLLSTLKMMQAVQFDVKQSTFFLECLTDPEHGSYPLLSYSLKHSTDEKYISELYQITSKSKLLNYEKRYLLESLRNIVAYDAKHIWLRNRSKAAFVLLIRKIDNKTIYDDNALLIRLLEFSNDLYGFLQTKETEKREHKGLIDPVEMDNIATVEKYLERLDKGHCITDALLDILKEELYEVMFTCEQGWLTFNIIRYRQLCRLSIIEQFIGKEVLELLDLIEKNSVSDFVEIKVEPGIDWNDEEYVHDYMVSHILTPGRSKQDQFYLQNLREAYYGGIVKICLKKDMANLAQYLPKMEKVENSFVKKGSTRIVIPLLEISEIVKHRLFKDSLLSRKLIYYFKSKVKTDEGSRQIREQYHKLIARIDEDKRNDNELLRLLTVAIQKNQLRVFAAFLDNLGLFIDVKEHSKVYFLIDWQLFESFYEQNHRKSWEAQSMPYVESEMAKYQRIFLKYLTKPAQCKSQKEMVQRAFSRFQELILHLEIDAIMDQISNELGIVYPKKFGFKMVANKMHLFFSALHERYPSQIPWLNYFNFQFCTAVKKRLGHASFIDIKEYFCKAFTKKPRLEPIAQQISFRMEEYEANRIIDNIDEARSFKPTMYFAELISSINSLAQINSFNPDIEKTIVKGRYPELPWAFLSMKNCLQVPYWLELFKRIEKDLKIYLQLLHYLETQDKSEIGGLKLLYKLFELVHAEVCANDLIRRIQEVLRLQDEPLFDVMLNFESFRNCPVDKFKILNDEFKINQKSKTVKFSRSQLLATLRIFALRGQYLTKVEKINNKLRNMLSDFDEASLDIDEFFKKSAQQKNQDELRGSLLKMLSVLFKYKFAFFDVVHRQKYTELDRLSITKAFARYREVDLKLSQVETINRESVLGYISNVLRKYQQDVGTNLNFLTANYQQAEFYHIVLFTSLRDREKYEYVIELDPGIKQLLESGKEGWRQYRNYLAHYNCCSTLQRKDEDQLVIMDDTHRQQYLLFFDGLIRKLCHLWK